MAIQIEGKIIRWAIFLFSSHRLKTRRKPARPPVLWPRRLTPLCRTPSCFTADRSAWTWLSSWQTWDESWSPSLPDLWRCSSRLLLNSAVESCVTHSHCCLGLQVRKNNVLKDFVAVAGPLGITHFSIFTKTENSINMVSVFVLCKTDMVVPGCLMVNNSNSYIDYFTVVTLY